MHRIFYSWAGGNYLHVPSSLETDDRFKKTVALRAETDPNKTKYLIDKSWMLATFNNLNVVLSSDCSPNHAQARGSAYQTMRVSRHLTHGITTKNY